MNELTETHSDPLHTNDSCNEETTEQDNDELLDLSLEQERRIYPSHEAGHQRLSSVVHSVRINVIQTDGGS